MDDKLIEQVKDSHKGKVVAFAAIPNMHFPNMPAFQLGVAVLGEAGYEPLRQFYDGYDQASEAAERLNEALGLDPDTSFTIVADTMRRSQAKHDAMKGLVEVKLEASAIRQLLLALEEAGIADDLSDIAGMLEGAVEDVEEPAPRLG